MSDLISRQAAIDALNEYFARIGKLKRRGLTKGEKAISLDAVGAIKTLPSAQPECKTGRWIPHQSKYGEDGECVYICNICGENVGFAKKNFCPNCGCKMEE